MKDYKVCAACGGGFTGPRVTLGMETCSGPCNARRRRETGLVDVGQGETLLTLPERFRPNAPGLEGESWVTFDESWVFTTDRPFVPVMSLPVEVEEGRTHEWRRGFTAGVGVGLILGLVLPMVALVGGGAKADVPTGPGSSTACSASLAILDAEANGLTFALSYATTDLREARAANVVLTDKVARQAATIKRLRERLAR